MASAWLASTRAVASTATAVVAKLDSMTHLMMRANGKMRACGDAGLQFRVSRVRV